MQACLVLLSIWLLRSYTALQAIHHHCYHPTTAINKDCQAVHEAQAEPALLSMLVLHCYLLLSPYSLELQ